MYFVQHSFSIVQFSTYVEHAGSFSHYFDNTINFQKYVEHAVTFSTYLEIMSTYLKNTNTTHFEHISKILRNNTF